MRGLSDIPTPAVNEQNEAISVWRIVWGFKGDQMLAGVPAELHSLLANASVR